MTDDQQPTTPDAAACPPRLAADLRQLARSAEIPGAADDAMRAAIHRHFADVPRKQPILRRRLVPWAAVAAAAVLALGVWLLDPFSSPPPTSSLAAAEPADLDANGRVDILDAFALARRLENGDAVAADLDLNADGRVDRRDVDALARRAVALQGDAG